VKVGKTSVLELTDLLGDDTSAQGVVGHILGHFDDPSPFLQNDLLAGLVVRCACEMVKAIQAAQPTDVCGTLGVTETVTSRTPTSPAQDLRRSHSSISQRISSVGGGGAWSLGEFESRMSYITDSSLHLFTRPAPVRYNPINNVRDGKLSGVRHGSRLRGTEPLSFCERSVSCNARTNCVFQCTRDVLRLA
jgi:hypothetical protein